MINGNEYSWEDVQTVIEGKAAPLIGYSNIEYTTKRDHKNIYGRGYDPVKMGKGRKDYGASITLLQSEVESMQRTLSKGQDLTDMAPFGITVAYAPLVGEKTVDQLQFVRIAEVPKGMKEGDPNQEITLPLVVGKILYNI